ncbi:MAG: ABC transporter substrate-binding protein [Synechococcales cyanobacterium]
MVNTQGNDGLWKRRLGRYGWGMLCVLLLLAGCSRPTPPTATLPPLKIGYSAWPGFLPVVIAQEKGYFQEQGVTVELEYSDNTTTQIADFTAENLDGAFFALGSVVSLTVQNPGAAFILVSDESQGADAVVANPPIATVADLRGKRVGTNTGGFGELFVTRMLEDNDLSREDVIIVQVIAEDVPQALADGTIDAGSAWEPFISQAVKGGAQVIFSSESTPGLIPDGLVVREAVLKERPEQLQAFLKAWFQAVDDWKADPAAGSQLIAARLGIPVEEVSLEGIKLLSLTDNLKAFTPGDSTESLHVTADLYANFFIRTGALSRPPDLAVLLNDSLLREVDSMP